MRKTLILLTTAFFLSCSSISHISHLQKSTFPVKSFVKIFKILKVEECKKVKGTPCKTGDEFVSTGSGISVGVVKGGSLIMTAGHVCQVSESPNIKNLIKKYKVIIKVQTINNALATSDVVLSVNGGHKKSDLCMLHAKNIQIEGVKLSPSGPDLGDKVFALSAPAGIFHPPTMPIFEGRYSGLTSGVNSMVTIPAIGGSSGSAILNNRMELVGILFATHPMFNIVTLSSSYKSTAIFMNKGFKKVFGID